MKSIGAEILVHFLISYSIFPFFVVSIFTCHLLVYLVLIYFHFGNFLVNFLYKRLNLVIFDEFSCNFDYSLYLSFKVLKFDILIDSGNSLLEASLIGWYLISNLAFFIVRKLLRCKMWLKVTNLLRCLFVVFMEILNFSATFLSNLTLTDFLLDLI